MIHYIIVDIFMKQQLKKDLKLIHQEHFNNEITYFLLLFHLIQIFNFMIEDLKLTKFIPFNLKPIVYLPVVI